MSTSLDRARATLPAQVQPPTIEAFSTSSIPVLQYSAYANESLADLATQLRSVALPKLAGLSGVSTVNLTGPPTQAGDGTLAHAKLTAPAPSVGQAAAALT